MPDLTPETTPNFFEIMLLSRKALSVWHALSLRRACSAVNTPVEDSGPATNPENCRSRWSGVYNGCTDLPSPPKGARGEEDLSLSFARLEHLTWQPPPQAKAGRSRPRRSRTSRCSSAGNG